MSPKKGDHVYQPAIGAEWAIRFSTAAAAKGWPCLENEAAGNLRKAWDTMRHSPGACPIPPNQRHKALSGRLNIGTIGRRTLPQWQIEVTSGGRIWYLLDDERHTVWVEYASTKHPKETE